MFAACHAPAPIPSPGLAARPIVHDASPAAIPAPGFERADIAVLVAHALVFYALGDAPTEVGRIPLEIDGVKHYERLGWADRDNLYVWTGPRAILHVTAAGATPIAAPRDIELFAVDGGAAWAGAYPAPGSSRWDWIELAPTPNVHVTTDVDSMKRMRSYAWPDAAPAGITLTATKYELQCRDAGRHTSTTFNAAVDYHWVSVDPPVVMLLIATGPPGAPGVSSWQLHAGCVDAVGRAGSVKPEPGPDGLWQTSAGWIDRLQIYRGARWLGTIPVANLTPAFRPPP